MRINHNRAIACEIVLLRSLAMRIISVGRPSCMVTTGCLAKMKRARGRENRAKISPVITARNDMPVKISIVAMKCP